MKTSSKYIVWLIVMSIFVMSNSLTLGDVNLIQGFTILGTMISCLYVGVMAERLAKEKKEDDNTQK